MELTGRLQGCGSNIRKVCFLNCGPETTPTHPADAATNSWLWTGLNPGKIVLSSVLTLMREPVCLYGLGQTLERHETQKRRQLGKNRPVHPIRYPADNSDPWYFGQGHQYTIIDSPWEGTVLTAQEVQQIHTQWKRNNMN